MTININGRNAQGEALPKIRKHSLSPLQIRANFDARASYALVAVLSGGKE